MIIYEHIKNLLIWKNSFANGPRTVFDEGDKPIELAKYAAPYFVRDSKQITSEITKLLDFLKDMHKEIDWSKEHKDWAVNHDVNLNLPDSCANYKKTLGLIQTRQKWYYIHRKLNYDSEVWFKDPKWFMNRSYYDLIFVERNQYRWSDIFNTSRKILSKFVEIHSEHTKEWRFFIEELLRYHQNIVRTPAWEEKFGTLIEGEANLVDGAHFHRVGFPKTEDPCYHLAFMFGSGHPIGYDHGTEGWMYSFWVRRFMEDTTSTTETILKWALTFLPQERQK